MLRISKTVVIPDEEIDLQAVRSQGAGGQNVNKVATAIHLFFDIRASSLPSYYKQRLLKLKDHRITENGKIVIKSQEHRSQEKNREAALQRFQDLLRRAIRPRKRRKPTRPTAASRRRRREEKEMRSRKKSRRGRVEE